MKMTKLKIISIIVTGLLLLLIFLLFKKELRIEGIYTSKELFCSCGHTGKIYIENNEIKLIFNEHNSVKTIGKYKLISNKSMNVDFDWEYIKSQQKIELEENGTLKLNLLEGSIMIFEKSFFDKYIHQFRNL